MRRKKEIAHLGDDVVIDSINENVVEIIKKEAENGHPIDIAIDCLAGKTIGEAFPYVNEGCRWVLISTLAGIQYLSYLYEHFVNTEKFY